MEQLVENFFNLEVLIETAPYLIRGLSMTLVLCAIVSPIGIISGAIVAVLGSYGMPWLRRALFVYVDLFRSLPPLVLLIFVYQGLPMTGIDIPALAAVILSFLLNNSA